jgi:hypothetical protein
MIVNTITGIKNELGNFNTYDCVVILCRYNGGKSSLATDLIHTHFGEENTHYVTFIDQSKHQFTPRKSTLKYNEVVVGKIIIFDEIADELARDTRAYLKQLIDRNLVIIISNPYASSSDADKEIALFKKHEQELLPDNRLFIFVEP